MSMLNDPLHVLCEYYDVNDNWVSHDVTLHGPGLLAEGTPAGQFLNEGEDFDVDFNQIVYFSDSVAIYRIVVTFTAATTF
jgi:hypothetical protein